MQTVINEYDVHLDAKCRITLRNALYEYYHVSELKDGRIILDPRELTEFFRVSENTLNMMDEAVRNMKVGIVSDAIDLPEQEE